MIWYVLILLGLGYLFRKKIKKWLTDIEVRKAFEAFIIAIDDAFADDRLTLEEICEILKKAKTLVDLLLEEKIKKQRKGGEK